MSRAGELIREFKTPNFTVRVEALPDDDMDLSWDDDGSVIRALERGTLIAFAARATVNHVLLGEIASDYLGGCVYESLEQFAEPHGYFGDMVRNVCDEARKHLRAASLIRVRA